VVVCVGSDGQQYSNNMCAEVAQPPDVRCPATRPCVAYSYRTTALCPTQCGYAGGMIQQEAECVNDNGLEVDYSRCGPAKTTAQIRCAPTAACEQPTLEYVEEKEVEVSLQYHVKHGGPKLHHPRLPFKHNHGSRNVHHGFGNDQGLSAFLSSSSAGYNAYTTAGFQY
jgi:hypothetical protein